MSDIVALSEEDKDRNKKEYAIILQSFRDFISSYSDGNIDQETFEDMALSRSEFMIDRVIDGMKMTLEQAYSYIANFNDNLTKKESEEKKILLAAIDNLIEFAIAEEYQMISELDEDIDGEIEDTTEYDDLCKKYNLTYASVENDDVLFAASIAQKWMMYSEETWLTYMTQQDERVRESHAALEGETYQKSDFPAELIPPIDFGCRCYLISNTSDMIFAKLTVGQIKKIVNPIFSDSLAVGGKIFSNDHPYFNIKDENKKYLKELKSKLTQKLNSRWQQRLHSNNS